MISETMPLNEWPACTLRNLKIDLEMAQLKWTIKSSTTEMIIEVVKQAIKDAEEREAKLPFE